MELLLNIFLFSFLPFVITIFLLKLLFSRKGKGKAGEEVMKHFLNNLDKKKYTILNDVNIEFNGNKAQIDHIVIAPYGIFVIETKVRGGAVYGSDYSKNWKQYLKGRVHEFRNPIEQNEYHIRVLRGVLSGFNTEKNKLNVISIIAFSGNTILKAGSSKVAVLKISEVIHYIQTIKSEWTESKYYISRDTKEKMVKALKNT